MKNWLTHFPISAFGDLGGRSAQPNRTGSGVRVQCAWNPTAAATGRSELLGAVGLRHQLSPQPDGCAGSWAAKGNGFPRILRLFHLLQLPLRRDEGVARWHSRKMSVEYFGEGSSLFEMTASWVAFFSITLRDRWGVETYFFSPRSVFIETVRCAHDAKAGVIWSRTGLVMFPRKYICECGRCSWRYVI